MSTDLEERMKDLLTEKFKETRCLWGVRSSIPLPGDKWRVVVSRDPYSIIITAYVDGGVVIGMGPVDHWDGISDVIWLKYDRRFKSARTEEEKEKIRREEMGEEKRAFEDFMQKRYEKYLKDRALDYIAKRHMWANEVAKRLSDKYGFSIEFKEEKRPAFMTTFDSTGMSEEQIIKEVLRRIDIMLEVEAMFENRDMMNEFLVSRGIEPVKTRRRG